MAMRRLRNLVFGLICLIAPASAHAQSNPIFHEFGQATGALYRPDSGPPPHVALLLMHPTANFMDHPACTELSKRGFMVLCMNSRYENNNTVVDFEKLPLDVKSGVVFLRHQPGITKVLLFAHSGGGPLMAFYQAVAENGPAYCQGPDRLVKCGDDLANLPPADGIVFADAHPGTAVTVLRGLNPAIADMADPPDKPLISSLDPFDPQNGYNPYGASSFSPAFQARYFAAQSVLMNQLIDEALAKERLIKAGKYPYPDDDIIIVPRGGNPGSGPGSDAFLWELQPDIPAVNSTAQPEKLLRNDGTIVVQIIKSVEVPDLKLAQDNLKFDLGTKIYTVKSFLSAYAIRSTNSVDGIDYCSSNTSTVCAVRSISVPVLFMAMGGHYFIHDNEVEFDNAKSKDKDFVVIEGATHFLAPCIPCETKPGEYSNVQKNLFDYAAKWINARY
jgi:hypothetical protein